MPIQDQAVSRALGPSVTVALLFLITSVLPGQSAFADWKHVRDADGISVYSQDQPDSKIDAIKGMTTMKTSLGALVSVLSDPASFPQWHPDFKEARLVSQSSFRERFIYLVNDMPWPAKDRDVCYRVSLSNEPDTKIVTFRLESAPGKLPESKHVRVQRSHGEIRLEPLADRRVRVSWTLFTDPRLSAPASMINDAVAEGRVKLLTNLRQRVGQAPYRDARLVYNNAGRLDGIHYQDQAAQDTRGANDSAPL